MILFVVEDRLLLFFFIFFPPLAVLDSRGRRCLRLRKVVCYFRFVSFFFILCSFYLMVFLSWSRDIYIYVFDESMVFVLFFFFFFVRSAKHEMLRETNGSVV